MPLVIGLDLSTTSTGMVVGDPSSMSALYTKTIKPSGRAAIDRIWSIAMEIRAEASNVMMVHQKDAIVVIEELHSMRNAKTVRTLAHLHGAVHAALRFAALEDVRWCNQRTAMAHIGALPSKDGVMKRVKALGFKPKTQDEADAICVWLAWKSAKSNR